MPITKEIFKAGDWTDSKGRKASFTEKDVQAMADNFNNETGLNSEKQKVPVFAGHPSSPGKAPAYAWIGKVWKKGKSLFAEFKDTVDKAEKALNASAFKDVSIAVSKNILSHVGLTNLPAVAGLEDFELENEEAEIYTFSEEFAHDGDSYKMSTIGRLFQGMRDYFVEKIGLEKANLIINQWQIDAIKRSPDSDFTKDISEFASKTEHAASVNDSKQFDKFARTDNSNKSFKFLPDGVSVVIGIKGDKNEVQPYVQSYKFSTKNFTAVQAKAWLKRNNVKVILFEPASKELSQPEDNMELQEALNKITVLEGENTQLTADLGTEKAQSAEFKKNFTDEKAAHDKLKTELSAAEEKALDTEDTNLIDGLVKEFQVAPAEKELILDTLKSKRGMEEKEFTSLEDENKKVKLTPRDRFIEILKARPAVIVSNDFSKNNMGAGNKSTMQVLVAEKMKADTNLSHPEASALVFQEHPELTMQSAEKTEFVQE